MMNNEERGGRIDLKELKIPKFSKRWFIKRNDILMNLVIILFWFMSISGGTLAVFLELENMGMSIVSILILISDFIIFSYTADLLNENYEDYLNRMSLKQKRKQDRKWKKWLI